MTRIKNRYGTIWAVAALSAGLMGLGACSGHGTYTSEGITRAQLRMEQMKAATEYDMARQQFLAGDLAKAKRSVDHSIILHGKVIASHVLRARILIEQGSLEHALESLDFALTVPLPDDDTSRYIEAHYYRGIVFERFDEPEAALAAYQAAMEADPSNPQYLLAASEMFIEMDRLFEAQQLLHEGRGSFDHNAGIMQTLGHIAMMQGDHMKAADFFERASVLGGGDPTLQEDQLRAQLALGEFADAETTLSWLFHEKEYADRDDLRHIHAKVLLQLDRPVEAREILMNLTSGSAKNDVEAWLDLGNAALVIDDLYRLRSAGQRMMAIAPDRAEGYMFFALYLRDRGQLTQAAETLVKGLRSVRNDARIAVLQGLIYQDMNNSELATRSFRIALDRDPSNSDALAMMAQMRPQYAQVQESAPGASAARGSELADAVDDQ